MSKKITCLLRGGNGAWLQGLRQLQLLILQLIDTLAFNIEEINNTSVADPDPGSVAFLTPGSGMVKMSGSGSGMNNPVREHRNHFFGLKYFNSLMRIRDRKNSDLR